MPFPQFYPIVPDITLAKQYIDHGVRFLQIRLKDIALKDVKMNLSKIIAYAKSHNARLVINDYWEYALELQAEYLHLGQEDLQKADIKAIKKANISLGISTHDKTELKIALALQPDYIALGPIYHTQLKAMKWRPQGIEKLKIWKDIIGHDIPLVAIGGITLEKADNILRSDADCVSVVTDISRHQDKIGRLKQWLNQYPHL